MKNTILARICIIWSIAYSTGTLLSQSLVSLFVKHTIHYLICCFYELSFFVFNACEATKSPTAYFKALPSCASWPISGRRQLIWFLSWTKFFSFSTKEKSRLAFFANAIKEMQSVFSTDPFLLSSTSCKDFLTFSK